MNLRDDMICIPAARAFFSEGVGLSCGNRMEQTAYDPVHGLIVNLGKDTRIVFTVPAGTEGRFDLYLTVSKTLAQSTSQPFLFNINDEAGWSVPVDCPVSADSPARFDGDGPEFNTGTFFDTAVYPIADGMMLHAGDTITVTAAYGAQAEALNGGAFPGVGDLLRRVAGHTPSICAAGGKGGDDGAQEAGSLSGDGPDPLAGKTIVWLGSSVTYGAASEGHYSMVDAIRDRHPGLVCEKYAISGTTLVNSGEDSYVARLMRIPKTKQPDLLVVQLSTNDPAQGKPMGRIESGFDPKAFNDTTVAGAMETIIAYARETFGCRICFYTGTYFPSAAYAGMVRMLSELRDKWKIDVIDLYNNREMRMLYRTAQYRRYMADDVHPFRAGYVDWWTPVIDAELVKIMASSEAG